MKSKKKEKGLYSKGNVDVTRDKLKNAKGDKVIFTLHLPVDQYVALRSIQESTGLSISSIIRKGVAYALSREFGFSVSAPKVEKNKITPPPGGRVRSAKPFE